MANRQPTHSKTEPQYKRSTMPSFLVSCYLILMFSVFPLFLTSQYSHARTDKYWLYIILSAVMIVSVVIASLMDYFEEKRVHQATLRFMPLSPADISFLCFYGFAAISTLVSDYGTQAFFGVFTDATGAVTGGRNNGLLLLTVYLLVYLTITRRYVFKEYVLAIYLVFSSVVSLLAVLNYFFIDPLSVYAGYIDLWGLFKGDNSKLNVILNFGSTLGNKNLISAFICLFLPIAVMCFVLGKKRYLRIIAGISTGVAYCGLLVADSGSGMLGLAVIIAVMAIFSARRYESLKRYFLALAILFASGKVLRLFSLIMDDRSKGFESIQQILLYSPVMYAVIVFFAVLFVLMQVFEAKFESRYPKKGVIITLTALTGCGILGGIAVIIYYSCINTSAELSEDLGRLLRFNESWGTHRGYYWIHSLEQYGDFSILHKLFGTGPDTAYAVMEPFFKEMTALYNEGYTDCVHNEFLNYFITQGALGLLSYLALLGTVTVRAIRRAKNDPMILIFLSAVICYAVQSVVNLYQPIVTPLFFIFLSITEALNRKTMPSEQS